MSKSATKKDISILQETAKQWMEIANDPVMEIRKRLWQKIKDLGYLLGNSLHLLLYPTIFF